MTIGELKERLVEIEEKFGPYLPVRMPENEDVNLVTIEQTGVMGRRIVKIGSK